MVPFTVILLIKFEKKQINRAKNHTLCEEIMEKIIKMNANTQLDGLCRFIPNLLFSYVDGKELRMQMYIPVPRNKPAPMLVFLQGSGWTYPNVFEKLPMFAKFARDGIAVAMIVHRNRHEGFAAPAFLEDAKTAVRFLRANAEKYNIDKEKIFFGGSSSGGNTALLMGQTGDDPRYKTKEYAEESDAVCGIIDACGPSDFIRFVNTYNRVNRDIDPIDDAFVHNFCGKGKTREERIALLSDMSPERVFAKNKVLLPTLIIHGVNDGTVPYSESEAMYNTLKESGCEVSFISIDGSDHDFNMWSAELYDIIENFILSHI